MPLEGIGILAISQFGAGSNGPMQLVDLGTEIIKNEDRACRGEWSCTVPLMLLVRG